VKESQQLVFAYCQLWGLYDYCLKKHLFVKLDSALVRQSSMGNPNQYLIYLSQEDYFRQLPSNFKSTEQLHALLLVEWLIFLGHLCHMVALAKIGLVSHTFTYSLFLVPIIDFLNSIYL
jgi:hypothetical protein